MNDDNQKSGTNSLLKMAVSGYQLGLKPDSMKALFTNVTIQKAHPHAHILIDHLENQKKSPHS